MDTVTKVRQKVRAKAKVIWQTAYEEGHFEIDFTGQAQAEKQVAKIKRCLYMCRDWYKARRLEHLHLVYQMECCSIIVATPTILRIQRNKITSKTIGALVILNKLALPEKFQQEIELKAGNVLNKFIKDSRKA